MRTCQTENAFMNSLKQRITATARQSRHRSPSHTQLSTHTTHERARVPTSAHNRVCVGSASGQCYRPTPVECWQLAMRVVAVRDCTTRSPHSQRPPACRSHACTRVHLPCAHAEARATPLLSCPPVRRACPVRRGTVITCGARQTRGHAVFSATRRFVAAAPITARRRGPRRFGGARR